jgi:hypothetical protein
MPRARKGSWHVCLIVTASLAGSPLLATPGPGFGINVGL